MKECPMNCKFNLTEKISAHKKGEIRGKAWSTFII